MTNARNKADSLDDPISYEFVWTLDRLNSKDNYFDLLDEPQENLWSHWVFGIFIVGSAIVSAGAYFLELEEIVKPQFTMAFILGVSFMLFLVLVLGFVEQSRARRAPLTPLAEWSLNLPPYQVTLERSGVAYDSTFEQVTWKWRSFQRFAECTAGILLVMGPRIALLVPDDALPEGLDRAGALRKLNRWKGPW